MTNLETHMYDWVFNYNPYTEKWQATHRDNITLLYSDRSKSLTSSSVDTLVQIVNKTNGDEKKIDKLLKNNGIRL